MSSEQRYARQISVREVGVEGQAALDQSAVSVLGRDPAAEICALYLAGAGVGRLSVDRRWREGCVRLNSAIEVSVIAEGPAELAVVIDGETHVPTFGGGPVARGAQAARWAMERVLVQR